MSMYVSKYEKKYAIFGENSGSRAKVQSAGWGEPRKTGASLRAFGFGPGSMPSLRVINVPYI